MLKKKKRIGQNLQELDVDPCGVRQPSEKPHLSCGGATFSSSRSSRLCINESFSAVFKAA